MIFMSVNKNTAKEHKYSSSQLSSEASTSTKSLPESSFPTLWCWSSMVTMAAHVTALFFCVFIIYLAVPGSDLFSWHPTLMVLAYALVMFETVLVFSPDSSLVRNLSHSAKVTVHWSLAALSALLAVSGLVVIFQVKENMNKSHFTSWHGLCGLVTVGYGCMQLLGGITVKYHSLLSGFIKMRLADHKMTHAVSGVAAFTLVTATLVTALYTSWISDRIQGLAWYACITAVSFIGLVVANQVTSSYLPRIRAQK